MKSPSLQDLDLMEHLAIVSARQQRDQYLKQLDQFLESLGDEEPSSLEELRRLFTIFDHRETLERIGKSVRPGPVGQRDWRT